jgi:hypothetical protein
LSEDSLGLGYADNQGGDRQSAGSISYGFEHTYPPG